MAAWIEISHGKAPVVRTSSPAAAEPVEPEGWQPSLFGGPGAASVLRQADLFPGASEPREPRPVMPERADQPSLFAAAEKKSKL
jgi:hypothetical protein